MQTKFRTHFQFYMSKSFFGLFSKPTLEGHELFTGKYHDGNVKCECVMQNGERVFDGPFVYEYKYGSVFSSKGGEQAEGTFSMNRKHGPWKFVSHSGQRDRVLIATFDQGRISGDVEYKSTERDYLGRPTVTTLSFSVRDGHVVGDVRGSLGGKKLTGFCDNDGYPDGHWSIEAMSSDNTLSHIDSELWSHGTLVSSYSQMKQKKTQTELNPYLRKMFSEIVNGDILDMFFMVRRGTQFNRIEIPHHEK